MKFLNNGVKSKNNDVMSKNNGVKSVDSISSTTIIYQNILESISYIS